MAGLFDGINERLEASQAADAGGSAGGQVTPPTHVGLFDGINARLEASQAKDAGVEPDQGEPKTSAFGAFATQAALTTAGPLEATLAGAGTGAELGAFGGPWGAAIGGFIGGMAGAYGGSKLQNFAIQSLPDNYRDPLEQTLQAQEKEHPVASFLGGLIPYAVTMNPFGPAGGKAAALKDIVNPTGMQKIMADPKTARVFGGAVQGGLEYGQEKWQGEQPSWTKLVIATGFGMLFAHPNALGEKITELGAKPTRRVLGRPDPTEAPPPPPPPPPPPGGAAGPMGRGLSAVSIPPTGEGSIKVDTRTIHYKDGRITAISTEAELPSVSQADAAGVIGASATERTNSGDEVRDPSANAAAQQNLKDEEAILKPPGPPPPPPIHDAVRQQNSELFDLYDKLTAIRAELEKTAPGHVAAIDKVLDDITPEIQGAYRLEAERAGTEKVEPPPPSLLPPEVIEAQKANIVADVKRQLIAAGRPEKEAEAASQLIAARFATRSALIPALGSPEELYRREGPAIKGEEPPKPPPVPPPSPIPTLPGEDSVDHQPPLTDRQKAAIADEKARELAAQPEIIPTEKEGDDLHNQGVAIWKDLKSIGTKDADGFARGVGGRLMGNVPVDESALAFWRERLEILKAQSGGAEKPAEQIGLRDYLEEKDAGAYDALTGVSKGIADRAERVFADKVAEINAAGFKVRDVNALSPQEVRDAKEELSRIAGSISRLVKGEHALTRGEETDKKLTRVENDQRHVESLLDDSGLPAPPPPSPPSDAQAAWSQLGDEERRDLQFHLETILERKGSVSWADIPVEFTNKIGTGEAMGLKRALAADPKLAIATLDPDYGRAPPPAPVAPSTEPPQPPGTVRVYHAGETPDPNEPRWVSGRAENYSEGGAKPVWYADVPRERLPDAVKEQLDTNGIIPNHVHDPVATGAEWKPLLFSPPEIPEAPPAAPPAEPPPPPAVEPQDAFIAAVKAKFAAEQKPFTTIVEARKLAKDLGFEVPEGESANKAVDELVERAVVERAREIVAEGDGPGADTVFHKLVRLYDYQPNLSTRTSTSVAEQAYSTPVPLAYVASRLAGITRDSYVLEPTAGNGMLLMEASPGRSRVNELNKARAAALEAQGFHPSTADGSLWSTFAESAGQMDVVIANPPFGIVREGGRRKTFHVTLPDGKDWATSQVDHAIALNALRTMKSDGKAVLIVGSVKEGEAETGYSAEPKRRFYHQLLDNYKVRDIFTVSGDLYTKQGAGWPVDVIVIEGKKSPSEPKTREYLTKEPPPLLKTWDEVGDRLHGRPEAAEGSPLAKPEVAEPDRAPRDEAPEEGTRPPPTDELGGRPPVAGGPVAGGRAGKGPRPGLLDGTSNSSEPGTGGSESALPPRQGPAPGGGGELREPGPPTGPEGGRPLAEPQTPSNWGANNTFVTQDRAAQLRERLRAKLREGGTTLNSGIDPEYLSLGAELATFHIEAGARSFADFVGAMGRDLGAKITDLKPYLRGWYLGAQAMMEGHGLDTAGMDDSAKTRSELERLVTEEQKPPSEPTERKLTTQEDVVEGQAPYIPASEKGVKLNTLLPANLRDATNASLERLEREKGNVDQYVADALGRDVNTLGQHFSAEQIDAIGLGISNIEKGEGFIIGDQTGIGKGRVVAAMISYARTHGMIPVFVTEDPGLYGDMWRDLHDIGWDKQLGRKISMVMTNVGVRVPLDEEALEWQIERDEARAEGMPIPPMRGDFSASQSAQRASDVMNGILRGEITPDAVFTTYDQMNSVKGAETERRAFLKAIAARSFLIMDEAHNAGGAAKAPGARGERKGPPPRSDVFREVVELARSVMYSSATYAKSPNVMTLYSKTDMAKAVANPSELPELISKGGVPLQQVVASMLSRAGQYLRRERSFEGVAYEHEAIPVSEKAYGEFTDGLRGVFEFDRSFEEERKDLAAEIAAEYGAGAGFDPSLGDVSAQGTSFASIMHNVINQMVMALKAEKAGERAVEALRAGEKPVIGLSKTNQSFINDFIDAAGLKVGDRTTANFGDILKRYLERTRRVTIKMPDDTKIHVMIPLEHMSAPAQAGYREAQALLGRIEVGDLPVSPIDAMRNVIEKAGFTVREITGRDTMLDYSQANQTVGHHTRVLDIPKMYPNHRPEGPNNNFQALDAAVAAWDEAKRTGKTVTTAQGQGTAGYPVWNNLPEGEQPIAGQLHQMVTPEGVATLVDPTRPGKIVGPTIVKRPAAEMGTAGKKTSVKMFNDGRVHALILNSSGATGISLHASSRFANQQKRRMIIAEADPNIDTHMQMLGRVHRTGQVITPVYTHLSADIPAEVRPTAVLMRKMASLNANTTGAAKSKFTSEAVDFLNQYGDRAVASILQDDPQLATLLGKEVPENIHEPPEDFATKVTGRLTLLRPEQQQEFLDKITEAYRQIIEALDATGTNDLEAKALDLQAKVLSSQTLKPPTGPSPFQGAVNLEKTSIKSQGRAMAPNEVTEHVANALKTEGRPGDFVREIARLQNMGEKAHQTLIADTDKRETEYMGHVAAALKDPEAVTRARETSQANRLHFREVAEIAHPGAIVSMTMNGETVNAVVIGFKQKEGAKSPVAPSSWEVTLAIPNSSRSIGMPLSRVTTGSPDEAGAPGQMSLRPARYEVEPADLEKQFEEARKSGREERYMMTGNLLAAYSGTSGRGQIITHTMEDGSSRPAILMSRMFNVKDFMEKRTIKFQSGEHVIKYLTAAPDSEIRSTDGVINIRGLSSAMERSLRDKFEFEMPSARATGGKYYTDSTIRAIYDRWDRRGSKMRAMVDGPTAKRLIDAFQRIDAVFETKENQDLAISTGEPARELPQGGGTEYQQDEKGKINVTPGKPSIITLAQTADASTFIHETSHDFFEQLLRDAAHPDAPDQLKADAKIARDWAGAKEGQKVSTKAHEKFARGFEQYMREGTAPTAGLARVFAQFKTWLTNIYQSIRGLGTPINDDIRRVFDRMLTEPERPAVVAGERPPAGPTLADIHQVDAHEAPTGPAAEPPMDRVIGEAERQEAELHPEIGAKHEEAVKRIEQEQAEATHPSGEAGAGAAEAGTVGEGGGGPGSDTGVGGGGEPTKPLLGGGGATGAEGAGAPAGPPGSEFRPVSGEAARHGPVPAAPAVLRPDTRYVDETGNIRLDNLNEALAAAGGSQEQAEIIKDALREIGAENDHFIGDRRRTVTDNEVEQLAEDGGFNPTFFEKRKIGQAFNAEQIWAARKLLVSSATNLSNKAQIAARSDSTLEDLAAYAIARDQLQVVQRTVAGVTAEAGRALRAFRQMPGSEGAKAIGDLIKQATGRTLFQIKKEAKLVSAINTTQQVSGHIARSRSLGAMILETWINNLISGLSTHVTYTIGNKMLSLNGAIADTPAAALVGMMRGRTGERVMLGEAGARLRGMWMGEATALKYAAESFRASASTRLPGQTGRDLSTPFDPAAAAAIAPQYAGEIASAREALSSVSAIFTSTMDAMKAGGALLAAGGVKGEPLWGLRTSPLGATPDITFKGVGALPLGQILRGPSRMVAALHSYTRINNYIMSIAAQAYREVNLESEALAKTGHYTRADGSVLTGAQRHYSAAEYAARLQDLSANPSEAMMAKARSESTQMALMEQSGAISSKLAAFFNASVKLPILGQTQPLKFIDPFVHISTNIIRQTVRDRSVVGLLSPEIQSQIRGDYGAAAADMAIAKIAVGTMYAIGFGALAAYGYARGSGSSDPRMKAVEWAAGYQPHSVRIGDMWYSVNRLGVLGMLASISADLYDVAGKADPKDMTPAAAALLNAFTRNILDESWMRGPADLINAVESPGRYGESYVNNFLSSFIPYSVGLQQMDKATDPYLRQVRSLTDAMKAKIPFGPSETLLPRRDIWGQPIPNRDALLAAGVTSIWEQRMGRDPVNQALINLGIAPAFLKRSIRLVPLTDQQYDDYMRVAGKIRKDRLDVIVNSGEFHSWRGSQQATVITEVLKQSDEAARGWMMMHYPSIVTQSYQQKLDKVHKEDEYAE